MLQKYYKPGGRIVLSVSGYKIELQVKKFSEQVAFERGQL